METMKDIELIDIVMNCEWDLDFRKHAAMEIMKRAGVNESWQENHKIMNP